MSDVTQPTPQPPQDEADVLIVSIAGEELARICLPLSATVEYLKSQISDLLGCPAKDQHLTVDLTELENGHTLLDYDVKEHTTVTLVRTFRPPLSLVFLGHSNAGKSALHNEILYRCSKVTQGESGRASNHEEQVNLFNRGLEYPLTHFETQQARFIVLDVCNVIKRRVPWHVGRFGTIAMGADVAVLVISARRGEFENGYQTWEHLKLAMTWGVDQLIIAVTKMDDVQWNRDRYEAIRLNVANHLLTLGFAKEQCIFLPLSGYTGDNISEPGNTPAWYAGPTLLDALDVYAISERCTGTHLQLPVLDCFGLDDAMMVSGKVEEGCLRLSLQYLLMPQGRNCFVETINVNGFEERCATCGEHVALKLVCTEGHKLEVRKGDVLCSADSLVKATAKIRAEVRILEVLAPLMSAGYRAKIHVHQATVDCEVVRIHTAVSLTDPAAKVRKNPRYVLANHIMECTICLAHPIATDVYSRLGRFSIVDGNHLIGTGTILKLAPLE